jgi:hypothetical protein
MTFAPHEFIRRFPLHVPPHCSPFCPCQMAETHSKLPPAPVFLACAAKGAAEYCPDRQQACRTAYRPKRKKEEGYDAG